ncbi:hypothetical protein GCM10025867_51170 (plasmid) [Frondihabitans sucicola]|uniref:Uncharacterized protein n=1 Tax=Frondihabitans sucicola TaxID=1268041 RepID=A0ABN6YA53_9MICO|nr:hypothetical protein [Frondihabitans sucicola]BDZ52309.1 hypothetical protein GCM10025867_45500 [Frondihabitans sucicola]BDZ52876.1 hypothetical protein GCM10025867_51170 [Frondihabitans sucicola]
MTDLQPMPPAPAYGPPPLTEPRQGRPASTAIAIVLLVLSAFALLCASGLDFVLWITAGGVDVETPHAQAAAVASTVVIGWIVSTALWWTSLVLTIRAIRRARRSWVTALSLGLVVGAVQIGAWALTALFQASMS